MSSKFFKKNKKCATWTLREIAVMVVLVPLIIAMSGFLYKVGGAILSQKDDGSKANFERLYENIKALLDSSINPNHNIDNILIGSGKILVGFDTNWDDKKGIIPGKLYGTNPIYKPFKCGNSACICLYANDLPKDSAKRDEGVIDCHSEAFVGKDIIFLSEGGNVKPKTAGIQREAGKGNYLVLYGKDWNIQETYIEKFFDGYKTYIYISRIDATKNDDPVNIRKNKIDTLRK